MKIRQTCRDVTRLVLQGQDRTLPLGDRIAVRLHMWYCKACPNFERQVGTMRSAMQRWRAYSENDDAGR
jgi:hypothetical protein